MIYLELRLGHLTTLLQVQSCETIPDRLEQLCAELHSCSSLCLTPVLSHVALGSALVICGDSRQPPPRGVTVT